MWISFVSNLISEHPKVQTNHTSQESLILDDYQKSEISEALGCGKHTGLFDFNIKVQPSN